MLRLQLVGCIAVMLSLVSCSKEKPFRKATFPVTGKIAVDGVAPTEPIQVTCHSLQGLDKQHPTMSQCESTTDGSFKISTYQSGDGVPEGEYVLTFYWGQLNLFSREYGGPDKLNDRYRDPAKSEVKFTVKAGQPTELGEIKLTAK